MKGVDNLFLQHGDVLIVEDQAHLQSLLDYVFSSNSSWVPLSRNNGRTTAHSERIFSQLPKFQSVQAYDAHQGGAKTFDRARVIVNDEARYWGSAPGR